MIRALDWYYLIREADEFSERTGWGLANVWAFIQREQYGQACEALRQLLDAERRGVITGDGSRKISEHEATRAQWRAENLRDGTR
jgi:hypothetical protein